MESAVEGWGSGVGAWRNVRWGKLGAEKEDAAGRRVSERVSC